FTDGRDTSPTGGADFLASLNRDLQSSGARIVTVIGRYYAMDRDTRGDRPRRAWFFVLVEPRPPVQRRARCDGDRSLLCDGPRQPVGSLKAGLGCDGVRR